MNKLILTVSVFFILFYQINSKLENVKKQKKKQIKKQPQLFNRTKFFKIRKNTIYNLIYLKDLKTQRRGWENSVFKSDNRFETKTEKTYKAIKREPPSQ